MTVETTLQLGARDRRLPAPLGDQIPELPAAPERSLFFIEADHQSDELAVACQDDPLPLGVREWCADPWRDDPAFRVVRGGAWVDPAWKLRAAYRTWAAAGERGPAVGFRVALAPD